MQNTAMQNATMPRQKTKCHNAKAKDKIPQCQGKRQNATMLRQKAICHNANFKMPECQKANYQMQNDAQKNAECQQIRIEKDLYNQTYFFSFYTYEQNGIHP
jgi:hypothetical protein